MAREVIPKYDRLEADGSLTFIEIADWQLAQFWLRSDSLGVVFFSWRTNTTSAVD